MKIAKQSSLGIIWVVIIESVCFISSMPIILVYLDKVDFVSFCQLY